MSHIIAIVGAGLSGLMCARSLLKSHSSVHVHILEARGRCGGRMYEESGVDLGATWSWPDHDTALMSLVAELGVELEPQSAREKALYERADGSIQIIGNNISPSGENSTRFVNGAASIIAHLRRELEDSERITLSLHQEVVSIVASTSQEGILYEITSRDTNTSSLSTSNEACILDPPVSDTLVASAVVLALPPQLSSVIAFTPPLPPNKILAMQRTPTWMESTGKVAFLYDKPFWLMNGLSGTVFSEHGPMKQIWDASNVDSSSSSRYALSSFVFDDDLPLLNDEVASSSSPIMQQLVRLFGVEASTPTRIVLKSWKTDQYTSLVQPSNTLHSKSAWLPFGHSLVSSAIGGIIFAGTETSPGENGHMNGAVIAGDRAACEVINYVKLMNK